MINDYKLKSKVIKNVNGLNINILKIMQKKNQQYYFVAYMVFLKSHLVTDI